MLERSLHRRKSVDACELCHIIGVENQGLLDICAIKKERATPLVFGWRHLEWVKKRHVAMPEYSKGNLLDDET